MNWLTYDGRLIPIEALTDSHLINISRWMTLSSYYSEEARNLIEAEVERRDIQHMKSLAPLPFVNGEGDWVTLKGNTEDAQEVIVMPVLERVI